MNRWIAGWVVGVSLLILAGGLAWWWLSVHGGRRGTRAAATEAASAGEGEPRSFELYFPADGDQLRVERRDLTVTDSPKDRVRSLVEALLAGPHDKNQGRVFPEGVILGSVQLAPDGVAYVDLRWSDHADPPPAGSSEEIQRVYCLVNTIAFNVPEANRVAILWNGVQRLTFSGHLDTSRPLLPDRTLLAR